MKKKERERALERHDVRRRRRVLNEEFGIWENKGGVMNFVGYLPALINNPFYPHKNENKQRVS
jgi:hypothetical protein